jgi:hypothetical protein
MEKGLIARSLILGLVLYTVALPFQAQAESRTTRDNQCRSVSDSSGRRTTICKKKKKSEVYQAPSGRHYHWGGYHGYGRSHGGWGGGSRSPDASAGEDADGSVGEKITPLIPTRALITASQMPPEGVGAYGVVAFSATPLREELNRYKAVCEGFKATLIAQSSLPARTPLSAQMITFWPVTNSDDQKAREGDCEYLVSNYDLKLGLDAIHDADLQGHGLERKRGPFLIAWSPARNRYEKDVVVLVIDLSNFESDLSFREMFKTYREKIVNKPSLWKRGFDLNALRLAMRDTLDTYGDDVLKVLKIKKDEP